MKLVTFSHKQHSRLGAVIGDQIIDFSVHPALPTSLLEFFDADIEIHRRMQEIIQRGVTHSVLSDVQLQAPIPRPGKYLGVSLNYADHILETGKEKPLYPSFFNKQSSAIIGHLTPIQKPRVSDKLDYEGELAFIIGKRCKYVPAQEAHKVIAGFTIANDVSVRDWQQHSATMTIGKSFDTCGPLGPWLVTSDEIKNPHALSIKTWVDDELRQHGNTHNMLFNCYELIAYLSQAMTLEPGDVITTGTPAGVGVSMNPRGYLTAGQTVRVEIEQLGELTNPIILEP